jgi:hypothetical protein
MLKANYKVRFDVSHFNDSAKEFASTNRAALDQALLSVGSAILRDAKLYVPILTGALKDSGKVSLDIWSNSSQGVRISFGSADVVYAQIQHDKEFWHPSLGFYGAAKYVSKPLMANMYFYTWMFMFELKRWNRLFDPTK